MKFQFLIASNDKRLFVALWIVDSKISLALALFANVMYKAKRLLALKCFAMTMTCFEYVAGMKF